MRVSVIMPVYNCQDFLAQTIESVLSQSMKEFEFIAVDDGSTDDSKKILKRYAKQDSRIKIISRPNTGIVGALNDGLAAAQAPLIARMDGDDLADPQRFEKQTQRMQQEPQWVALGSCAALIDKQGESIGHYDVPLEHDAIEQKLLAGQSAIHHPAVMMRTDRVREVGGYREGFCPAEDYDLWLRLGEVGRLANLSDRLLIKRQLIDGLVGHSMDRRQAVVVRALADAWKRRGLPGEPPAIAVTKTCKSDWYRQWAWMALREGNVRVARRYALKSVMNRPFHRRGWRALMCALRGR